MIETLKTECSASYVRSEEKYKFVVKKCIKIMKNKIKK